MTTMVELGHQEESLHISNKKKQLLTTAMKRTSEWIFSQEIMSDVTIHAGGVSFSLHKFPLVCKCGYIRKLVSGAADADLSVIEIPDVPGGAEAFELAAKFCYGVNFEISTENIAMLRCVAEYLEMTEEYSIGNLVERTEAYLNEVALKNLSGAVSVLHVSETFLSFAEKVNLVSQCIDAITYIACKESQLPGGTETSQETYSSSGFHPKAMVDWWAEDLTVLRIDIFQRVIMAMITRGFTQYALGPVLMLYAQKSLRGLDIFGKGRKKIDPKQEHEKRVVLETIVSLLPRERNAMSVSFLSMLLRASIYLETTVACRLDLEKRMAFQLGQAVLDDLLIPAYSFTGDTLFDVDTIQRIMENYLEYEMDNPYPTNLVEDGYASPRMTDMERVGKLMENYLSEIASDRNLALSKFISLAELIPEQSRIAEDGMYRSIDIYLKAHPSLSDMERKKVCSLMDCQKLSREACAHAAQNDRLPVQTVVQVLYYEQQRLRDAMTGNATGGESPALPHKVNVYSEDFQASSNEISNKRKNTDSVANELASLRRENEDLKMELARMRMRLKELDKQSGDSPASTPASSGKPPLVPRKSIINSVSKKLGRLYPFVRPDGLKPDAKARTKPSRDRRHSIS